MKNIEDFYVQASGNVLTEQLPYDWESLDDFELDSFVEKNAWEPFESWSASRIWEQIHSIAYDLYKASDVSGEHRQNKWTAFLPEDEGTHPKNEDTYIVYNNHSKKVHAAIWLIPEKQWSTGHANEYFEDISYWQPLPEPPNA